jgi:hypothetical protein
VAEKFQAGRELKYRAGIRKNGLQGVIPYLVLIIEDSRQHHE